MQRNRYKLLIYLKNNDIINKIQSRINRALNEKMYLLNANKICVHYKGNWHNTWVFHVEGSRGVEYTIEFNINYLKCTCPHFKTRQVICKHMFFIIGRVSKLSLYKLLNDNPNICIYLVYPELNSELEKTICEYKGCTNDIYDNCVICFDSLEQGQLDSCITCKNYYHTNCIERWMRTKQQCPLCRTFLEPKIDYVVDVLSKLKLT